MRVNARSKPMRSMKIDKVALSLKEVRNREIDLRLQFNLSRVNKTSVKERNTLRPITLKAACLARSRIKSQRSRSKSTNMAGKGTSTKTTIQPNSGQFLVRT